MAHTSRAPNKWNIRKDNGGKFITERRRIGVVNREEQIVIDGPSYTFISPYIFIHIASQFRLFIHVLSNRYRRLIDEMKAFRGTL
jgi:hypothetical protein